MPKGTVRLAESAVRDLEDLRRWYARQGVPEAGTRTLRRIRDSIGILAEQPEMGRVVPEFGQGSLRELIRPHFRIVYRRESEGVAIVRVWRSERVLEVPEGEARD
ncbi:MAG: type II toxin-antitoxin system RelE/ParE family toxin [Acidobacteria bacterium]|nr:type II toxin-antitoxin system RelE/ParE family toxin [Acidobacteriota bacterium]MYF15819.1 type II toxin-antitoxin system RelE/ParE family toxin [Acidobacteriota bacterium]MYI96284.1 type II toxin-antitoxin system RelE/ParE family toxin [Acidobacteriota bacterium]